MTTIASSPPPRPARSAATPWATPSVMSSPSSPSPPVEHPAAARYDGATRAPSRDRLPATTDPAAPGTRMGALGRFAFAAGAAASAPSSKASPTAASSSSSAASTALTAPPIQDFLQALIDACAGLTPERTRCFLAEAPSAPTVRALGEHIATEKKYLQEQDSPLPAALQSPKAWKMGDSRGHQRGGMALWRNDVFPNDFFVAQFASSRQSAAAGADVRERIGRQPWMEWDAARGSLAFHADGASRRLLDHLQQQLGGTSVTLYRGTSLLESTLLDVQQQAARGTVPSGWQATLRAALQQPVDHARKEVAAWEGLVKDRLVEPVELDDKQRALAAAQAFGDQIDAAARAATTPAAVESFARKALATLIEQGRFGGEFVTPDKERAAAFSKGKVVQFDVTFDALRAQLDKGALYVGLEQIGDRPAVELAFLPDAGSNDARGVVATLTQAYAGSTDAAASQLFH